MRDWMWAIGFVVAIAIVPSGARGDEGALGAEYLPRLIALTPDQPMAYFELAEEISYEIPGTAGRDLATHMLIVALELDRRSAKPVPLGRSVCLALADVTTDSAERAWLLAMARSLTPAGELAPTDQATHLGQAPESNEAHRVSASAAELAFALARFRGADARPIRALLDGGSALRILTDAGMPPGPASDLLYLIEQRIPELRRLRSPDSDGRVERYTIEGAPMFRLDPATHGHPGPVLTDEQTKLVLGAEARLLGASPESWASDDVITMGQPVRDINPASLAAYYKVDVTRVYFVPDPKRPDDIASGRWSAGGTVPASDEGAEKGIGDEPHEEDGQRNDRSDEQPSG